jgi:hypothetical protein
LWSAVLGERYAGYCQRKGAAEGKSDELVSHRVELPPLSLEPAANYRPRARFHDLLRLRCQRGVPVIEVDEECWMEDEA